MTKREKLVLMLDRYHEFTDPSWGAGAGRSGDGGNVVMGPHDPACLLHKHGRRCTCWRLSFDELDRSLKTLRGTHRGYRHLHARYFLATNVQRRVLFRWGHWQGLDPNEHVRGYEMSGKGTMASREYDVVVTRWPAWVSLAEVDQALDTLEQAYQGEPELPADALAAAGAGG